MHARFGVNTQSFDQGLTRLGVGYYLTPNVSFWGGYYYSATKNSDTIYENRLWQQLSWNIINQNYWQLSSRNRLAQRKNVEEADIAWSFRERIQLTFPGFFKHKVRPIIDDEVFFNLNNTDWTSNNAIDQNRLIIGLSWAILKQMSLEVDYINQYKIRSLEDEMNHILALTININP